MTPSELRIEHRTDGTVKNFDDKFSRFDTIPERVRQTDGQTSYETALFITLCRYKKAQLSLTNPRDAKACQKLLQFDVHTTLSLTILAYLNAFSCCCVRNLRNPEKFTEHSNL